MWLCVYCLSIYYATSIALAHDESASVIDANRYSVAKDRRYLLYDVNHGEGFNLRRDVYLRVSNLVRQLREKGHNFVLVLPPWGGLYHWQTKNIGDQLRISWSLFFDIASLNIYVPVIEFEQYLQELGRPEVDKVFYLQHFAEGWKDGKFEEKWEKRPCIDADRYYQKEDDKWRGWFWGYGSDVYAKSLECVSVQGQSSTLLPVVLRDENTQLESILIDRAETVLHDHFGDVQYWRARRSMRYSSQLRQIADEFRRSQLTSYDETDGTVLADDWSNTETRHGQATGGPYLAVHWRRKDFVRAHGKHLPSVNGTAQQIIRQLQRLNLDVVFVATDAPQNEIDQLVSYLPKSATLKRFIPSSEILGKYKDGGVSIIDQWICAHARHFIGSYVSTFSFRIHEDREILGFDPTTTFNRLCPDSESSCEQPAKWKISYD